MCLFLCVYVWRSNVFVNGRLRTTGMKVYLRSDLLFNDKERNMYLMKKREERKTYELIYGE